MKFKYFIALIFIIDTSFLSGQDLDSLLLDDDIDFSILSEDSLLLDELDSLSIFTLLDSILNTDYKQSQLALRLGFTSDVVNAGRDLGINQNGLLPGISYFHSSGVFASLTGYWNSQSDPKYNLTVASLGYFGELGKKLTYSLSYEHSFYANSVIVEVETDPLTDEIAEILDTSVEIQSDNSLTSNASAGLLYDFKKFYVSTDYSLFFGNDVAHRWDWRITGNFRKKNILGFDRITLLPSISILMGNEGIITTRFDEGAIQELSRLEQGQIVWSIIQELGLQQQFRRLSNDRKREFIRDEILPLAEFSLSGITEVSQKFGVLNYALSAPVNFRKGNLSFTASYNYNIPQELPGEDLDIDPSGYISLSFAYYIGL